MGVRIPPPLPFTARRWIGRFERRLCRRNRGGGSEGWRSPPPRKKAGSMGVIARVQEFFREVMLEFKRVTWPSRQELLNSTAVVIVVTVVLAFFLGLVDIG